MNNSPFASPLEETVVIVGVGLIGGSLAAALVARNVARRVIGVGRDASRIEAARRAGLIQHATTDFSAVAEQADLIVFCTPVDSVAEHVRQADADLREVLRRSGSNRGNSAALFTDVGSVKASICEELADVANFIGSHPIAGSHRQGFEAADANLFNGRRCVITPNENSPESQVERLERFWRSVGMRTQRMSPDSHDHALATTSHLPHIVAAALATTVSDENRSLTGSGFRDTTRIAAGDPELWRGILMNNAESVVAGIDEIQQRLSKYRTALVARDGDFIRKLLAEGQNARSTLDHDSGADHVARDLE